MNKFFTNIKTVEELKKEYRKLAKKHHPDVSNDPNATDIMKALNKEYEVLHEQLNSNEKVKHEFTNFTDFINEFLHHDITIDIVGTWVWVHGKDTFAIKDKLKTYGFRWSKKHKKWYHNNGTEFKAKKGYKNKMTYNEITLKHGLQRLQGKENNSKRLQLT